MFSDWILEPGRDEGSALFMTAALLKSTGASEVQMKHHPPLPSPPPPPNQFLLTNVANAGKSRCVGHGEAGGGVFAGGGVLS